MNVNLQTYPCVELGVEDEAHDDIYDSQPKPNKRDLYRMDASRPCDFSFKKIQALNVFEQHTIEAMIAQRPRAFRVGSIPRRGRENKYLTRSIWLNNNRLTNLSYLKNFVDSVLVYPAALSWLDFSFNRIQDVDDSVAEFPNLKILYFHGNDIKTLRNISKLRRLEKLRNVTFHGNPIERTIPQYRNFVVHLLPQIHNLDFITVTKSEKESPEPAGFKRMSE